jgi:hypothetical protein
VTIAAELDIGYHNSSHCMEANAEEAEPGAVTTRVMMSWTFNNPE